VAVIVIEFAYERLVEMIDSFHLPMAAMGLVIEIRYWLEERYPRSQPWTRPSTQLGDPAAREDAMMKHFTDAQKQSFLDACSRMDKPAVLRAIREAVSSFEMTETKRYDCDQVKQGNLVFLREKALTHGLVARWEEYANKRLQEAVRELTSDAVAKRDELDEASGELAMAGNPLAAELGIADYFRMAIPGLPPPTITTFQDAMALVALDDHGKDLSPTEIADHMTYLYLSSPLADARSAGGLRAPDATIARLQARFEEKVKNELDGLDHARLVSLHHATKKRFKVKKDEAKRKVQRATEELDEWARGEAPALVREIEHAAETELAELADLKWKDLMKPDADFREIRQHLEERTDAITKLKESCARIRAKLPSMPRPQPRGRR